jgi:hypothetical protein
LSLQTPIWKKPNDSGDLKQTTLFKQFVHNYNNNHNNNSKTDPSATAIIDKTRANKDFQTTNPGNLHNPQEDINKVTMGTLLNKTTGHKLPLKTEQGVHQLAANLLQEVNLVINPGKQDFKNQTTPPLLPVEKST